MKVLDREFYERDTIIVARELLGKILEYKGKRSRVTEVEAYLGENDPAAHASRKKTKHKSLFWGKPGFAYVYLNYGIHWCLNAMTEPEGTAGCVLFRSVEDATGPGRLTKYFGITGELNGEDMVSGVIKIWDDGQMHKSIKIGPRIGISKAKTENLRFWVNGDLDH